MYSIIQHKSNRSSIATAFAFVAALSIGCSSCSKCEKCTKASTDSVKVCEKDYSSNTEYGAKIDYYQALGYTCKSSAP